MEELLEILEELHPEINFEEHDRLIDDKVLDSFDIITLIAEINDEYDVAIPVEHIIPENFNSAKTLYQLIEKLLDEDY
ncbi:MAG TPA: acyl carrier protein [Clostridiales bacterium]|nr:acyl carrier protein [Clostridiales bacterium]